MNFLSQKNADLYIPDDKNVETALSRTTHLAVGAHQDDIELMAYHGIAECYKSPNKWFTGVVVTDGANSPRAGSYKKMSAAQMIKVRVSEQRKAAKLGQYGLQLQLGFKSSDCKKKFDRQRVIDVLEKIFLATKPEVVYLHNLFDKHDTHVAVFSCALQAFRRLPKSMHPKKIYGCEVWRDLDWLPDNKKVILPVSKYPDLAKNICAVFRSQIMGGKRYDLGVLGRRRANATFLESSAVDKEIALTFAVDLSALLKNKKLSPSKFAKDLLLEFQKDIQKRIGKFGG